MKLNDIALIGADTVRTRAYLQLLLRNEYIIHHCYILTNNPETIESAAISYQERKGSPCYFERDEPVLYTLYKSQVPYTFVLTNNINSALTIDIIRKAEEKNLIYSGFGGQIIKKEVFDTGKTFIHVHSGILPMYRGSTTIYYSLLNEDFCGASAFVMTPGLDNGDVIAEKRFPMPQKGIDIDYIYDPYIRAEVLVEAVEKYLEKGSFEGRKQQDQDERTYYIAHPVLRHIVRLMQDSEREGSV